MSYAISIPATTAATFDTDADAAVDTFAANLAAQAQKLTDEATAAIAAARDAAGLLIGAVGEGTVNVSISGHANPGHEPAPGWSQDFATVTVTRVPSSDTGA